MLRILVMTFLALALVVTTATAQTATTTQSTTPTSNPNQGAFDELSPGNQKIARALYDAQPSNTQTSGSSTTSKTYSRDDIAAMKQSGKGWGVVFKDMKAQGYYPEYKNLGQVISGSKHQGTSGTSGRTTITTASGKSQVIGKSGKGHFGDSASGGTRGSSGVSSGSGKGHGSSSGPSSSAGGGGNSGQGGGRGK
jgi:hypothetical protein